MPRVYSKDIVPTTDKHCHTPGKKISPYGSSFILIPSLISLCHDVWAIVDDICFQCGLCYAFVSYESQKRKEEQGRTFRNWEIIYRMLEAGSEVGRKEVMVNH